MKKACVILIFSAFLLNASAQNEEGQITFGLNAGFSLVGVIIENVYSTYEGADNNSVPAIQLTADYALTDNFSVGGALSFQPMGTEIKDYDYHDVDGNYKTQDLDLNLNRTNIAARALFHYGNMDDVDLYSGLRVGFTLWTSKHNLEDSGEEIWDRAGAFAPQVILMGVKGYIYEDFGLNFEVCIGAPHYLSMGLVYRLN